MFIIFFNDTILNNKYKHCGECMRHLQKIRRLKIISIALALIITIAMPGTAFAAASTTWTAHSASDETGIYRGIAWSPQLGIFVVAANGFIMTSSDGITW